MTARTCLLVCACAFALSGCGRESEPTPAQGSDTGEAASAPAATQREFSGAYRVSGKTVEKGTSNSRTLGGTIILVQAGDGYTATFELETALPTPEGDTSHAQVIGKGEGVVADGALKGTAQTQIVWADVPGVNSNFAFVPKRYGPRITSSSVGTLQPDGSIVIEIDSEPAAGAQYAPTHTTLRGSRVPAGKTSN
jgi:hypothetical protein